MTAATFDLTGALPSGTVVLEASAGTGKTFAIAALATRFVAEGTAALSELMLVTFSRAATQELRSRVRSRFETTRRALSSTTRPTDDPVATLLWDVPDHERATRAARLAAALADFDAATIATTHEFCNRMLAGLGHLADTAPLSRFVEDLNSEIHEAVVDLYVARYADLPSHERPFTAKAAEDWVRQIFLQPGIEIGPDDARDVGAERVDFCRAVRDTVERRKRERGISTYEDMLTRLDAALSDPDTGELACARLAERFPVVLIDEFQDTDPVQWSIVNRAFVGHSTVVLIGDPKQAIYGFRGADVYSYLEAVNSQARVESLDTNHRSDQRYLRAIEAILAGAALGEEGITVRPVRGEHPQRLHACAPWDAAVRIRLPAPTADTEVPSAAQAREAVDADLVDDISRLLASDAQIAIDGCERNVCPRDIAIVVWTNPRGHAIMQRLAARGIPAVFSGTESVYATVAAQEWLSLLQALESQSPADARRVALTSFFGWTLSELAGGDEALALAHADRLRRWAALASERSIASLIERIWAETELASRLLQHPGGERALTDLRHIAQNLQSAEREHGASLPGLITWLTRQIHEARMSGVDDRTRRLETDAEAVHIMTVHRSKGLQFPIVYLPQAGDRYLAARDEGQCFVVHELGPDGRPTRMIDVGGIPADRDARQARASRFAQHVAEDAGDDLRKLYVALTRAQCQVTCWWVPTKYNLASSSLHRALFREPTGVPATRYDVADLGDVRRRLEAAGVSFQQISVSGPDSVYSAPPVSSVSLAAARFTRPIDRDWRRTSYSGLTSQVHETAPIDPRGYEPDEPSTEPGPLSPVEITRALPVPGAVAARLSPMAELPGGTQFGSLVHAIFESVDPMHAHLPDALLAESARWLDRYPLPGVTASELAQSLEPPFRTPLGDVGHHLTLADISPRDRLPELDFELPLGSPTRSVTLSQLADLIERHLPPDDLLAPYPALLRSGGLGEQRLRGFLTGSIDALLRLRDGAQRRFVVVDYKTNRLGAPGAPLLVENYSRAAMADAMLHAHYPLQALLYAVATHRFLRWRLPGYDPDRHLGGVLYLFVRGMAGPEATTPTGAYGVFDWKPPSELIVELSSAIGGVA